MSQDDAIASAAEVKAAVQAAASAIAAACRDKDPNRSGSVATGEFRKVLYFEAGLSYATVNELLKTAPSTTTGMIDYEKFISRTLFSSGSEGNRNARE